MKSRTSPFDILPLLSYEAGCDYHRIILPLKKLGVDFDAFTGKNVEDVLNDVKLVFFNRTPHNMLPQLLELRKKKDFRIVVDIDDYWVLYPHHYMYHTWNKQKYGEQMIAAIKIADAVTCTTDLLRDKIVQYNKNVHVIPNAFPFGEGQFNSEKIRTEQMRFIYAGVTSHFWDIKELSIPFQKINTSTLTHPYEFVLAGYSEANEATKQMWTKMERSFNLNGKLKNYRRVNGLPIDNYMNLYGHSDVSLIPLESNNFNRFKSNLKIIEAGCKYNPAICSNVSPYSDEVPGVGVMYANNAREWAEHIKYCTQNPSFVFDMGQKLGIHVRTAYSLERVNEYRKQLFDHLIS